MFDKFRKNHVCVFSLFLMCVYSIAILKINFSGNPDYYATDMYSDMCYAAEAWMQKTIFPDGWVFGNQLYAVSTPVLAAVFYGLTNDHCLAMAIASTVMGVGVLLSFNWMLKPVFRTVRERVIGIVAFMSVVLFCGNPIHATNGWQLLFTMCSYYACYAIAVFLAFGCFLRSGCDWSLGLAAVLLLACILAFGTGIQSLRQTAIMVCPLIAVEALQLFSRMIHKEKIAGRSLIVTGLITASNLSGVLYAKMKDIEQVEIFGSIGLVNIPDALSSVPSGLSNAVSLFIPCSDNIAVFFAIVSILAVLFILYKLIREKKSECGNLSISLKCWCCCYPGH